MTKHTLYVMTVGFTRKTNRSTEFIGPSDIGNYRYRIGYVEHVVKYAYESFIQQGDYSSI